MLTSLVTDPRIWPVESTSRGTFSVSASPKQRKASRGGGTMSHTGKSVVLGISMAEGRLRNLREERREFFEG